MNESKDGPEYVEHYDVAPGYNPYPKSAPINKVLGSRPLIVETYSRANQAGIRHYWRVRHTSNREIMAQHRGYVNEEDRDHAVDVLWPDLESNLIA